MPDGLKKSEDWHSELNAPFNVVSNSQSGQVWDKIPDGHKWLDYFPVYDREFSRFVEKSPKIIEIGVYKGASLALWKKFFGEGSTIVGIDIDPSCSHFQSETDKVTVEIGSQNDVEFLKEIVNKHGPFDIIIDDGSHIASHQITSFNALFLDGLKDIGLYFIEDLECNYWGHTNKFRDLPITSMDYFKMLVDIPNDIFTHYEYDDFALHSKLPKDVFKVKRIAKYIECIRFYRGLVIIEKASSILPPRALHK